jgi:hypothetical protein
MTVTSDIPITPSMNQAGMSRRTRACASWVCQNRVFLCTEVQCSTGHIFFGIDGQLSRCRFFASGNF